MIEIKTPRPFPQQALGAMVMIELHVQENMGFSPSRISFIFHLSWGLFYRLAQTMS